MGDKQRDCLKRRYRRYFQSSENLHLHRCLFMLQWQDPLNPHRYRYVRWFDSLASDEHNCIVAIVIVKPAKGERFVVTAYQDYLIEKR